MIYAAISYKYTPDYMQLTVKTRGNIKWSDGVPFSADDVAYTFSSLVQIGSKVKWGADVQQFVKDVAATDPNTVVFNFKVPAPRFFDYISYKYDIGVYIAPKHIFEGKDWTSFTHFDISKGWPVTTGPWKVVFSSPEQKILDLRDEWWGEAAGVAKKPQVQRIVYLPDPGEQGLAQGMIQNQFDITTGIQPTTFDTVFKGNPKVTTWTGQKSPFGYMDWWPHSMYVNCEKAPFNNPDVRWALSSYIDRNQIVDVAWSGAATTAKLPIPDYPGLLPFEDAVKDLLQKYNTLEFNPPKGDALLQKSGFKKQNGKWMTPEGKPFTIDLISFFDFTSVGPVIVEQFKRQGIDATYSEPPDMFTRFSAGDFTGALFGHGGSYGPDPYYTLRLYQTASEKIAATHQTNYSLWKDPSFDKIVDDMYTTSPTDKAKIMGQWIDAMKIWLPALPDIMIEQGYHRLPTNTTYWKGWPSAEDPYVNSAFFHLTPALIVHKLEPVQ